MTFSKDKLYKRLPARKLDRQSLTKRDGYIPAAEQVRRFIQAGKDYDAYKSGYFHYQESERDDGMSPLPYKMDFDELNAESLRMKAIYEEGKAKRLKEIAASKASMEPPVASKPEGTPPTPTPTT